MSCTAVAGTLHRVALCYTYRRLANVALDSLGATLTDTLDDLITDTRIDPQLAMKILANFDRAIADVLQDKVKARLTFKVRKDQHPRARAHTSHFVAVAGKSTVEAVGERRRTSPCL